MTEEGKLSTVEEEEEEPEESNEEGGENAEEGENSQYYKLEPNAFWAPDWSDDWDTPTRWPVQTAVYEPGVLTYAKWSDMVYYHPTTLADLPGGVETIARVPQTVANAVADIRGNIPRVYPEDVTKVGDGLWRVNWDTYLSRNWDQSTGTGKYMYSGPSIKSVMRFVRNKAQYGRGFKGQEVVTTPANQLDTSATPNPAHPWVPGTTDNLRIRGEDLFQSPAGSQPLTEMVGTGGQAGPGVGEVYGAGIPTFSKCNC